MNAWPPPTGRLLPPPSGRLLRPPTGRPLRPPAGRPLATPGFRPDVEGLRAVAVLLVLVYHAELAPFTGGYLGVDVFYVISGFLITGLLLRELEGTGGIGLRRFWARRARRLLPASSLVLVATLVGGVLVLDPLAQADLARDGLAAAMFVVNILFARQQGDYLTADAAPSALLHYWSLSLEEQFYLVWPLLLAAVAVVVRKVRRAVTLVVVVVWPLSLAACILLTKSNQPWAFFSLPTRAWELLTGAALALGASRLGRLPRLLRAATGWTGLAVVVACSVLYSSSTPFPGVAALAPVLATAAILVAGVVTGPVALLRWGPLQWIGRRSYAIYLWHWPALVLLDVRFGPLTTAQRVGIVIGSIGVAAVSFELVEDPVRHARWLAATAARGLALGASLIGVGVASSLVAAAAVPSLGGNGEVVTATLLAPATTAAATTSSPARASTTTPRQVATTVAPTTTTRAPSPAELALAGTQELAAANVAQLIASVQRREVPANLRPSVRKAQSDLPTIYTSGCHLDARVTKLGPCVFGDPAGTSTVVLFGDSHVAQWFPAFDEAAKRNGWKLLVFTKKGCPTADIAVFSPMVNRELTECEPWRQNVAARLAAERPDVVVMSSYRYRQVGRSAGIDANVAWRDGLDATLSVLRPLTAEVLVLGDTPTPAGNVPGCLSANLRNVPRCNNSRARAVKTDVLAIEQDLSAQHQSAFIPTGDWLCTTDTCPVVVGDVLVYRDGNHITATAATWLTPYVEAAVGPLLADAAR